MRRNLCGMTLAEYGDNFALHTPFLVPLTFGNKDGLKFGVRGLQANAIMIFLLEETFEGCAAATSLLKMDSDNDIAIVAGSLGA